MREPSLATAPALYRSYTVAGRPLRIEAAGEAHLRAFERVYAGWQLHTATCGPPLPGEVTVRVHRGAPPPPPSTPLDTFETSTGWRCHTDRATFYQEVSGVAVYAHASSPAVVDVWPGDADEGRRPVLLAHLVFEASCAAWRRCGLFNLHAGACVEPSTGHGVLFVGPSGSGKSTLTIQLAAAGWRYLSDDALLLAEEGGGVEAWGLRRAFAVTEEALSGGGLRTLKGVATQSVSFDRLKRRFHPADVFPSGHTERCAPRTLFFTSLTHERRSRCLSLSPQEAMSRLLVMCPWACFDRPAARGYISALAALVRQCASYQLLSGTDLLGDPGYAADYISARAGAVAG